MTTHDDLLLEIGTEELPPRALKRLSRVLHEKLLAGLAEAALDHGDSRVFATPRRLAVQVDRLSRRQPDRELELRGPPVRIAFDGDGQPTRAGLAFAEKCGIDISAIEQVETDKGAWLIHRATEGGHSTGELLPGIIATALDQLPIPRRMRWGDGDAEFVRPVHWVVLLHGTDLVDAEFLGVTTSRSTHGHRFHAPDALTLAHARDYETTLSEQGYVIADFSKRRDKIKSDVATATASLNGHPVGSDELYDEVTALVEWPVAITAEFADQYLALPDEVLIETLQAHQRYFPVRSGDGRLLPHFVTLSNIDSRDVTEVREGNQRVVRPRLADAAFFFSADSNTSLEQRVAGLDQVVFQKQLGSLGDKTRRVTAIANWIATRIGADPQATNRAALLAKCDLLTDMVGEFPALQGTMGRYYAIADGESDQVAAAIEQHYWPRFAGDELPADNVGRALAIADKTDSIVGIFAIGKKPSGTRDPFGLRRSALGVLRIVIENRLDIELPALIAFTAEQQPVQVDTALCAEVGQYFTDRLRGYFVDDSRLGVTPQVFDAVVAASPAGPADFAARIEAVRDFARLDAADALAAANKRIANILRTADAATIPATVDPGRFQDTAERVLYEAMHTVAATVEPLLAQRDYQPALASLADLRPAVDRFFDDCMVMADDLGLRGNRLALLRQLRELFLGIADISRLQVG